MSNIAEVVSQQISLPSAPAVVSQLTTLMTQDDVSSQQIANLVMTDQAFTARTLKLVNSPFYGFSRQITSVEEAVTMLGVDTLQQLLLTTSVVGSLQTDSSVLNMDDFWLHSFSVGVFAKHLLHASTSEAKNQAFVCGVMHDIGRLLLLKMDSDRYAKFYDKGQSVTDLITETEWFGCNHQEAGKILAQKWNFPDSFVVAIAHHHQPEECITDQKLLASIHLADIISHALHLGHSGSAFVSHFTPEAWHLLELEEDNLPEFLRTAMIEIEATKAMIRGIAG